MLAGILARKQDAIAQRWVELVFESYPQETSRFLAAERDPFSNPVGRMLRDAAHPLVRALTEYRGDLELVEGLTELMRLRSVQDMTAAQAVGIVPLLRSAVMDVVGPQIEAGGVRLVNELGKQIERLMLVSFDVFVLSRERLYEIRIAERERHTASLLKRAERILAGSATPQTGDRDGEGFPVAER